MDVGDANTVIDLDGNFVTGIIYKSRYLVTRDGRIYTYKEKVDRWRQQKDRHHRNGYRRVVINRKDEYVHRIVALCYVDNPRNCSEVNHIDGNKCNNCADNLEWCTRSENSKHAFMTGLRDYKELTIMANNEKKREANKKYRKLTYEQAQEIRKMKDKSDTEIADMYGVARACIYGIRKNRTYKYA